MAVNKKEKKSYSVRNNSAQQPEQKDDVQVRYQQDLDRYQAQIEKTRRVLEGSDAA